MKKNILFVYPSLNFQDFSVRGIKIFKYDGSKSLEDYFSYDPLTEYYDSSIINQLNLSNIFVHNHIGTWQRWLSSRQDEISKYRDLGNLVIKISLWLKYKKISKIIFWTSTPHHVDTALIEIAARLNKINSLFFYYEEVLTKNYIPMYRNEFKFRYDLNKKFKTRTQKVQIYLKEFSNRINKKKKAPWVPRDNFLKKNFYFGILYLIIWHFKKKFFESNSPYQSLKEIDLIEDFYSMLNQKKYLLKLMKEDKKNSQILNRVKDKIIIYGNYQPESTTLSEGGDFRDQINIIKFLNLSGYKGEIFYKEHNSSLFYFDEMIGPTRVGLWKNLKFFKNLTVNKTRLILRDFSISNNIIITCSGSIALERSIQGFKTIICGNPWYGELPGVIRIEDVNWKDREEIKSLKTFSGHIKKESKEYLLSLISFSLKDKRKKIKEKNDFYSMIEYVDNILKDDRS